MGNKKHQKIYELCKWINSLDDEVQLNILSFMTEKSNELNISEEYENKFYEFINVVIEFIVKDNISEDEVKSVLEKCELNKLLINPIANYSINSSKPYIDAKFVKAIDEKELQKICIFVVNKMLIYKDYKYISFDEFNETINVENKEIVRSILSFLMNNYLEICKREQSPEKVISNFMSDHKFSRALSEKIIKPLTDNLQEVQNSYLLNRIELLLKKTSLLTVNEEQQ